MGTYSSDRCGARKQEPCRRRYDNPCSFAVALLAAVALAGAAPTSARPTLYLAPAGDCGGTRLQEMLCLHDYARHQAGYRRCVSRRPSMRAAWAKSADIARCGFSHTACGHPFSYRAG